VFSNVLEKEKVSSGTPEEKKQMKHLIKLSNTRDLARSWLAGALLFLSGTALHAQCSSWKCFNPAPIPLPSRSTGHRAANILSPYSEAQDAINNTVNQFRSILRNEQSSESDGTSDSVDVPDNTTESDSQIEADIEQMRIEREVREAAEAARRLEEQRNRDAANLLSDANSLLQSTDPSVDCAALMSTYYSGKAPALPSQCMSDVERMSVYSPGSPRRIAAIVSSEPVIDGSNIPSSISFSPALQELTSQTASASGDTSNTSPQQPLQSEIQPTDDGSYAATPLSMPADGTTSPSEDQTEGPSALDHLRDTAVSTLQTANELVQSGIDYAKEELPGKALEMLDGNHRVIIPDPAAEATSSLVESYGLPSVISGIIGDQLVNRLESRLQDLRTDWDQVNADPNGRDALDFSKAQDPSKIYQIYDYPTGILKVLDNKLGKFNDQPADGTPSSNQ
jgi:hypothetical protein